MVDARLRDEWLGKVKFDLLPDAAWRVFTGALMWSAKNGTDGDIPSRYLRVLHPDGEKPDAFEQLIAAAVWSRTPSGFYMADWSGALGQSPAAVVETQKENARVRQAAYREKMRQSLENSTRRASGAPSVTRDVRPHVGEGEGEGEGKGEGKGALTEATTANPEIGYGHVAWSIRVPGTDDWVEELQRTG